MYDRDEVTGIEDTGQPIKAVWKEIANFKNAHAPLYPDGLLELLEGPEFGICKV